VNDPDYDAAMKVRREVLGDEHVDRAVSETTAFTAPFQDLITRYAWGDVWARPGLDRRTRSCITLAVLAALHCEDEIPMHVRAALRHGVTREEIQEILSEIIAEDKRADTGKQNHDPNNDRNSEKCSGTENREAGVAKFRASDQVWKGCAVVAQLSGTPGDVESAKSGDEGGDVEPRDQQPVHRAHQNAEKQDDHEDRRNIEIDGHPERGDLHAPINEQPGHHRVIEAAARPQAELAELRPLQLLLAGGRELLRAAVGVDDAILDAAPDRHQRLAREYAIPQHLALRRLWK
jgi:4-carboxymuconolactone decarboxylase